MIRQGMTRAEHYLEAEKALVWAQEYGERQESLGQMPIEMAHHAHETMMRAYALAQVHATLANASLAVDEDAGRVAHAMRKAAR